jgi:hypothetical protein
MFSLIVLAAAGVVSRAHAENLLNSGFETLSGSFPAHWTKPYANGYETSDTSKAYTGSRCIKINDTSASAAGGARSDPVPVTPGKKYIASIRCFLESGTTASFYLEYRDAAGALVAGQSYSASLTKQGSWETITVIPEDPTTKEVLAAPAGATNLTVLAYSPLAQVGVSYWDSATVTEVANVAVPNASFETLTGGFPTDWSKPYANGYESSSTTRAYLGSRSLKINDTSTSLTGGVRSAPIPVIPGRKYIANIKCYLESGTSASLYLEYWNAEGTQMLSYHTDLATTGSWQNITVIPQEPVSKALIGAPYGASYLTIMAYSPQGQQGVSYFDSASVIVDNIDFATGGVVAANPGFENVDGTGFPLEWSKYGDSGFESGSTTNVFAGARSVRVNDTSASANGGVESKKFPVIEGKSYKATAKCFVQSGQFQIYIRYFDNESDLTPKSYTPDEYLGAVSASTTGTGSWQDLTIDFTPPFLAKYASILLYSNVGNIGDAYFDSVSVAALANGLSNGSFEDWSLSGYPHSWSAHLNSANIVTSASTERFYDIARSLKITDSSTAEGGGARSNRITAVTAGKSYTAGAKVYVESGSLEFYVEFWNASNVRLLEKHTTVSTTGSWQSASVTETAPTGTAYATVLLYSSVTGTGVAYADAVTFESEITSVTNRRQLFIDDYLIKNLTNVTKTVNQGTTMGQVVVPDQTWENNAVYCYGSLLYDAQEPSANKFKLYYTSSGRTCYAVSSDGVNWTKPSLGLYSISGSTANNVVISVDGSTTAPDIGLSVVIDPNESDPNKRFKAFGKWRFIPTETNRPAWYRTFFSADGKTFSNPVDTVNGWDVANLAYDAANARFVASVKYFDNVRRVQRIATSTDGITWTTPIRNESLADTVDTQGHMESDSYGLGWYPYEGVYIGFDWVFQIDSGLVESPGQQVGLISPHLVFSRDLAEAWYRPSRTPIIARGAPGAWDDGAFYTTSYALNVHENANGKDWVYLYYGAFDGPHSQSSGARIGLAKWRLDGFVSLNAGSTEGTVLTKPLTFTGSTLKLNVDASGSGNYAKVELLDATGSVIAGHSAADSAVINTDDNNVVVTWNGSSDLSALAGQTIQVKFYLKNAKLYALQFQ